MAVKAEVVPVQRYGIHKQLLLSFALTNLHCSVQKMLIITMNSPETQVEQEKDEEDDATDLIFGKKKKHSFRLCKYNGSSFNH